MTADNQLSPDDSARLARQARARVEAQMSYRIRKVARLLIGRPIGRYPPPSWTPLIVTLSLMAVAAFAWAVARLVG